jgi:phytoene synthase
VSHPRELAAPFEAARRLRQKHGKSYYFATRLFPPETRRATHALYAFFRVPDEIVDGLPLRDEGEVSAARRKLCDWHKEWERSYRRGDSADPILRAASHTFHRYGIPYEYGEHFLAAMMTDLEKRTYRDYDELLGYMYGSAGVVGLMMAHVIGFEDASALDYAPKLGYAMQLTNFLRDIDEDYAVRGRVYMPQDELAAFGLSNDDIASRRFSARFEDFLAFQSARAHALYEEADRGIPLLRPEGRLAVRVASTLYRAILYKIEDRGWNVFVGRARTGLPEKILLTLGALRQNGPDHA